MRKEIYLIRHGQTDWNKAGRFQGQTDIPLNDTGRRQAKSLRESLKEHMPFDRMISSDLSRARETAAIINEGYECPIVIDAAFRELCFGKWEGLVFDQIKNDYPLEARYWATAPHLLHIAGGESLQELFGRVWPRFIYWTQQKDYRSMAFVCHGGTCGALLCGLLNKPLSELVTYIHGNTALNVAELDENGIYHMARLNDQSHLGDESGAFETKDRERGR